MKRLRDADLATLRGFRVEGRDGEAGRIEQVLYWSDSGTPDYIVIGTGRWFFSHKAVLPVDQIEDVDIAAKLVRVNLSCKEIRSAPEFLPLIT